jgi:hypothetical protein
VPAGWGACLNAGCHKVGEASNFCTTGGRYCFGQFNLVT